LRLSSSMGLDRSDMSTWRLSAKLAADLTRPSISAPLKFRQRAASSARSTSRPRNEFSAMRPVWIWRRRAARSGAGRRNQASAKAGERGRARWQESAHAAPPLRQGAWTQPGEAARMPRRAAHRALVLHGTSRAQAGRPLTGNLGCCARDCVAIGPGGAPSGGHKWPRPPVISMPGGEQNDCTAAGFLVSIVRPLAAAPAPPAAAGRAADLQDLQAALLVGQADLDMHLQPPRAQQRLVQHVLPARVSGLG